MSADYMADRKARYLRHKPFDVQSWYPLLAGLTPETKFIKLTVREASSIVRFYQDRYNRREVCTLEDLRLIGELEKRLEAVIYPWRDTGAFVRMSSRSPKDGIPLDFHRFRDAMEVTMGPRETWECDVDGSMRQFCALQSQILKVSTATEALALLLSSERVFVDLMLAIDAVQQEQQEADAEGAKAIPDDWDVSVVIRRWEPRLLERNEYRVFVNRGVVTAASQYNHYCVYEHLQDESQTAAIAETLYRYVTTTVLGCLISDEVDESSGFKSFVVDVALLTDNTPIIVELNPYDENTGAAMFDWRADGTQLQEGPFSLRVRSKGDTFPGLGNALRAMTDELYQNDGTSSRDPSTTEPDYRVVVARIRARIESGNASGGDGVGEENHLKRAWLMLQGWTYNNS